MNDARISSSIRRGRTFDTKGMTSSLMNFFWNAGTQAAPEAAESRLRSVPRVAGWVPCGQVLKNRKKIARGGAFRHRWNAENRTKTPPLSLPLPFPLAPAFAPSPSPCFTDPDIHRHPTPTFSQAENPSTYQALPHLLHHSSGRPRQASWGRVGAAGQPDGRTLPISRLFNRCSPGERRTVPAPSNITAGGGDLPSKRQPSRNRPPPPPDSCPPPAES
jgi:hypothetical protein